MVQAHCGLLHIYSTTIVGMHIASYSHAYVYDHFGVMHFGTLAWVKLVTSTAYNCLSHYGRWPCSEYSCSAGIQVPGFHSQLLYDAVLCGLHSMFKNSNMASKKWTKERKFWKTTDIELSIYFILFLVSIEELMHILLIIILIDWSMIVYIRSTFDVYPSIHPLHYH